MKAVAYTKPSPITEADSLVDITLDKPTPEGRDLLVRIKAVSVNPVDVKVRGSRPPQTDGPAVLGWDAVGVVDALGDGVENFKVGDEVFYAGSILRQGTNSEFHLVDERIVGHKPASLSDAEAAALPLTTLTAWEMLFDRLKVKDPTADGGKTILVIGGSGGVGSIAIQLLRSLTDLTVIASASRPETQEWVRELGAHHVVDHSKPMAPQIEKLGIGAPGYVFSTNQTEHHFDDIVELIAPQGRFGLIDDPSTLNVMPFKLKAVSTHWELMFTRAMFTTSDISRQSEILNELAKLVDAGKVKSTMTQTAGKIDAATLKKVHAMIESNSAKGKIVLEGF